MDGLTIEQLQNTLDFLGVRLTVVGGHLEINAPAGFLDAPMRQAIATHRDALLQRLAPNAHPSLSDWLAETKPLHVVGNNPLPDALLELQEQLFAYVQRGHNALAVASQIDTHRDEAERALAIGEERFTALTQLIRALAGFDYDRSGLACWCAAEAFLVGDMAAVLSLVDAASRSVEPANARAEGM